MDLCPAKVHLEIKGEPTIRKLWAPESLIQNVLNITITRIKPIQDAASTFLLSGFIRKQGGAKTISDAQKQQQKYESKNAQRFGI